LLRTAAGTIAWTLKIVLMDQPGRDGRHGAHSASGPHVSFCVAAVGSIPGS